VGIAIVLGTKEYEKWLGRGIWPTKFWGGKGKYLLDLTKHQIYQWGNTQGRGSTQLESKDLNPKPTGKLSKKPDWFSEIITCITTVPITFTLRGKVCNDIMGRKVTFHQRVVRGTHGPVKQRRKRGHSQSKRPPPGQKHND